MKLRNKSKLVWNNGYITTKKGKLVALPNNVLDELDMLEVKAEQNLHELKQPQPVEPEPFTRLGLELPFAPLKVETPLLDQKVEESMALMEEIDEANTAEKVTEIVKRDYPNLARFVAEDEFIPGTRIERLNLPLIKNPLELDEQWFLSWVLATFMDMESDDE